MRWLLLSQEEKCSETWMQHLSCQNGKLRGCFEDLIWFSQSFSYPFSRDRIFHESWLSINQNTPKHIFKKRTKWAPWLLLFDSAKHNETIVDERVTASRDSTLAQFLHRCHVTVWCSRATLKAKKIGTTGPKKWQETFESRTSNLLCRLFWSLITTCFRNLWKDIEFKRVIWIQWMTLGLQSLRTTATYHGFHQLSSHTQLQLSAPALVRSGGAWGCGCQVGLTRMCGPLQEPVWQLTAYLPDMAESVRADEEPGGNERTWSFKSQSIPSLFANGEKGSKSYLFTIFPGNHP